MITGLISIVSQSIVVVVIAVVVVVVVVAVALAAVVVIVVVVVVIVVVIVIFVVIIVIDQKQGRTNMLPGRISLLQSSIAKDDARQPFKFGQNLVRYS